MGPWEVIVAVGAELDLPEPVRFGDVRLGCAPRNQRVQFPPESDPPVVPGPHVAILRQATLIRTSTFYWVVVQAVDDEDAIRIVERDIDPVVSVGLSLMLGHDVTTQVVRSMDLTSKEPPHTVWGADGQLRRLEQRRPDKATLSDLLDALRHDDLLAACLPYVSRAAKYLSMTPTAGSLAFDAALLELAKALERLVRQYQSGGDESEPGAGRIIATLKKSLDGSRKTQRKANDVVKAAEKLRRLKRGTVADAVRSYSDQHNMGTPWRITALRLINVRNRHLAHPGKPMSNADRKTLSQPEVGARAVVYAALRAALETRSGVTVPDAPATSAMVDGNVRIGWAPGPVAQWVPVTQPDPDKA